MWPTKQLVIAIMGLLVFVFFYSIFATIVLHQRFHPYWRAHPVAWTTLTAQSEGLVQSQWRRPPPPHTPLPKHLRLKALAYPLTAADANAVSAFVNAEAGGALSPDTARAAGTWFVLQEIEGGRIVGSVSHAPLSLDTPAHTGLGCLWIDNLAVGPAHRGAALCTCLIDAVIANSDRRAGLRQPPVGLFMSERPLPFPHAAAFVRKVCEVQPAMLVDNPGVRHARVRHVGQLPHRATEVSDVRVRGGRTIEPAAAGRREYWERVLTDGGTVLLSVDGTDWIHLHEADEDGRAHLYVRGFSCNDPLKAAMHIQTYLKSRPEPSVRLVATAPFHLTALTGNAEEMSSWATHDVHKLYFYNYRLNSKTVHVPNTWNIY
jgi:hypothetical protein